MYQIKIRKSGQKGRGVYALKNFTKGEIIERCPVIELSEKDATLAQKTILDNYLYDWGGRHKSCLQLGYGLIYNHSYQPNARYYFDYVRKQIYYLAIKPIPKSREITVNYNFDPGDKSPTDVPDVPGHKENRPV